MSNKLSTIGDYVLEEMASWGIPGTALAVIRGNEVLHMAGYGLRNVEAQLPVTPDTCFPIASCTKAFTAMGVALLVDEGKVSWDAPVRDYLDWFKLKDDYITGRITLRDMLSHRSGLPRHDMAWYRTPFTREELVRNVRHHEFSKGFREVWQYQNLMYVTSGYITGHVSGMTWEAFIQKRIFDALGMTTSCFSASEMQQKFENHAIPYRIRRAHAEGEKDTLEVMPFYDESAMGPAGSIHCSLADLVKWLTVHLNDGRYQDMQLVSSGNLTIMHQPQMIMPPDPISARLFNTTIAAYGLGWFIAPYRGYTLIEHGGNIDGFSLNVAFVPQEKIGIIALTNADSRPLRDYLRYEIIDRLLGLPNGDWHTKYHAIWAEIFKGSDQDKATAAAERIPDTNPSHPLADYAGEYAAEGYADLKVRVEGDKLMIWLAGEWWPLTHYHYDIFQIHIDRFELQMKLSFTTDHRGSIAAVAVPIEPAVKDVIFNRKPVVIEAAVLEQLTGVYNMPFEGMALTVTLKNGGRIFAQVTGQPETEMIPYKVGSTSVEFTLKDSVNAALEFERSGDGKFDTLLVKQFGAVYKAARAS